jgi:hypothetical protein
MKLGMHAGQDSSISQYNSFDTWLGGKGICVTRNVFAAYDTWAHIAAPYMLTGGATMQWLNKGTQYQEVIGIGMCPQPGSNPSSSGVKLSDVAGGAGDTYWTQLGQNINKYCGTKQNQVVLRLGWEMNGDWYQWGYGSAINSWNSLSSFISAWKRIVPLVRANAPGVKFEWCPTSGRNIDPNNSNGYIASGTGQNYPGDSYVDIIGLDVYDQYDNGGWLTILNGGSGVIVGGLKALRSFAIARGKPEAYTEWGLEDTNNGHADNPTFILGMYCWLQEAAASGSSVDHHALWNSSSGGPNAAFQGSGVGIITGSISGTTLTVSSTTQGTPAKYHFLQTADPLHNIPIIPGTQITGGSSPSFTVNQSQNVPSQTINVLPAPQSAQLYRTLFSKQPAVQKIAAVTQAGVLVPASAIPANYGVLFDGTNFHVALV